MLAEKAFLKKRIKASLMLKTMPVVIVSSNIYYVNYDLLTIKDLRYFLESGKIISGKARIYPTLMLFLVLFDLSYTHYRQKKGDKIPLSFQRSFNG